jgi:CRISPR-associated protein Cmr4
MPTACLYFVHALSPLHPGTGQGTGVIDLPIAREKATGIPYLPGSSVKGTLRDSDLIRDEAKRKLFFGPETDGADEHAGAAQFADARLLLLPIRSLRGTFAWVTSPYLLRRLAREAQDAGLAVDADCTIPTLTTRQQVLASGDAIRFQTNMVVLEDLDLNVDDTQQRTVTAWAGWIGTRAFGDEHERAMLNTRLCIVHDDVLSFLLTTATEVVARVRLQKDRKTVDTGALWYEEALPTESVLVGLALGQRITARNNTALSEQEVMTELAAINDRFLQFGGKATIGRGLCRVRIACKEATT